MKKTAIIIILVLLGVLAGFYFSKNPYNQSFKNLQSRTAVHPIPTIGKRKPGIPVRIFIPSLNVNANVESVAKDSLGRMDVPQNVFNTAWYDLGPRPGEEGSAVIDGHFDTKTGAPSVFYNLLKLKSGDKIETTDDKGKKYTFEITEVKQYDLASIPLEKIFSKTGPPMLNLITCAGYFDHKKQGYTQRAVVYSFLKQ